MVYQVKCKKFEGSEVILRARQHGLPRIWSPSFSLVGATRFWLEKNNKRS